MDIFGFVLGLLLGLVALALALTTQNKKNRLHLQNEEARIKTLIQGAEAKAAATAREYDLRAETEKMRLREELEKEFGERDRDLQEQKRRIDKKEEQIERKLEQIEHREQEQEHKRLQIDEQFKTAALEREKQRQGLAEITQRLEQVAGLTMEEAKAQVIASIQDIARHEAARLVKQLEDEAREVARKKAQDAMATAIQRYAGEFVAENTVSVVAIPSDDMKGRIIGREGRNIRALEAATGCDLIIDDTPEAVVISGFNPVRRQVARRSLEELVTDGRIHPARIEEVVKKARKAVNNEIREAGEQAIFELGLHGVHAEIVKLLGTLKFRTSYSQNVLAHSIEVGFFAGIMADELGLDAMTARRCGLLHDIGKAVDHDIQGSHAVIGGQLAKKFKESSLVVNAIWAHHFDIDPISVYAPLTNAADALSAARPGARRENLQTYIKRLESLEKIATGFKGVEKAYAIQAGRELRVIVGYEHLNDEGSMLLARDIARQVEEEMTYPGQVKVTVIREMRATEIAN